MQYSCDDCVACPHTQKLYSRFGVITRDWNCAFWQHFSHNVVLEVHTPELKSWIQSTRRITKWSNWTVRKYHLFTFWYCHAEVIANRQASQGLLIFGCMNIVSELHSTQINLKTFFTEKNWPLASRWLWEVPLGRALGGSAKIFFFLVFVPSRWRRPSVLPSLRHHPPIQGLLVVNGAGPGQLVEFLRITSSFHEFCFADSFGSSWMQLTSCWPSNCTETSRIASHPAPLKCIVKLKWPIKYTNSFIIYISSKRQLRILLFWVRPLILVLFCSQAKTPHTHKWLDSVLLYESRTQNWIKSIPPDPQKVAHIYFLLWTLKQEWVIDPKLPKTKLSNSATWKPVKNFILDTKCSFDRKPPLIWWKSSLCTLDQYTFKTRMKQKPSPKNVNPPFWTVGTKSSKNFTRSFVVLWHCLRPKTQQTHK